MRYKLKDWAALSDLEGFVRLIVLVDWDPIGILGHAGAMVEYDSYAPGVCDLLRSGASAETTAAHLGEIETHEMSHPGNPQTQMAVSEKLVMVHRTIVETERAVSRFKAQQQTDR